MDLVTSFTEMEKTVKESVEREIGYLIWNILSLKYPEMSNRQL